MIKEMQKGCCIALNFKYTKSVLKKELVQTFFTCAQKTRENLSFWNLKNEAESFIGSWFLCLNTVIKYDGVTKMCIPQAAKYLKTNKIIK